MDCLAIIKKHLVDHGFDGLVNEDAECGCPVDALAPCCGDISGCQPAYDHGPFNGYDNWYSVKKPAKSCGCRCPHDDCQHAWTAEAAGGTCRRCGMTWEAHRDQLLEEEQIANIQRYS